MLQRSKKLPLFTFVFSLGPDFFRIGTKEIFVEFNFSAPTSPVTQLMISNDWFMICKQKLNCTREIAI